MQKGCNFGMCDIHGIEHRLSKKVFVFCDFCGGITYKTQYTLPRFCNNSCFRQYNKKYGLSIEHRQKQRASIKKFIDKNKEWWVRYTSENGRRLQRSGKAYRHQKGWKPPLGFGAKVSLGVNKMFAENPNAIERIREARLRQKFPFIDSSIERKLKECMKENRIEFVSQYRVPFASTIDIAIPQKKVAIYCDGDYWHSFSKVKERDASSTVALELQGWKVLRFSESVINNHIGLPLQMIKEVV